MTKEELNSSGVGETVVVKESGRIFRYFRNCLALGALSLTGGLVGAAQVPVEGNFGPHRAEVQLTFDNYAHIDAGPLGPIRIPDQSGGLPLGARLRLNEIPITSATEPVIPSLESLQAEFENTELREYANLYTNVEQDIDDIKDQLILQVLKYGLATGASISSVYMLIGATRRRELLKKFQNPGLVHALAAITIASATLPSDRVEVERQEPSEWIQSDELFNGTPLEGAEVRGEIMRISLGGIRQIVDYHEQTVEFYQNASTSIREITQTRSLIPEYLRDEDVRVAIITSDLHCNYGMNQFMQTLSDVARADMWLDTGDITMNGSVAENICLEELVRNMPAERLIALGNHDSNETQVQAERLGFQVLDGEITTVEGISFLGIRDPNRSYFGSNQSYRSDLLNSPAQLLKDVACQSEDKPIILAHNTVMALPSLVAGCSEIAFSGHSHNFNIEEVDNEQQGDGGLLITNGSSGGAGGNGLTIGIPGRDATILIAAFRTNQITNTSEMIGYNKVVVTPEGEVLTTFHRTP